MRRALALLLTSLISFSPLSAMVTPSTGDAFIRETSQLVTRGNVTSITPPGRPAHIYTYDAGNQVSGYTAPDIGAGPTTTNYAYDLEGHPTLITRPDGQTLTFDYNAGGQLSTVTTPSGTYGYSYDSAGRLSNLGESATGINLSYTYDGTLPLSTTWTGPVTGDVSRTYDNNFRVVSQSVNGANTINYAYDNDGLLTSAGEMTLTRDAENGLLSATSLGVVNDAWTYNTFGEPTNYTAKTSGADAYSATFTRDALGRITTKNETLGAESHNYVYTYDESGRLTTVQKDATPTTYTYDDNGNRIKHVAGGITTNGTYDAQDRLLSYGGNTYTYTPNGELKTKTNASGTATYTYDVAGNLRTVVMPEGKAIEYLIDGQNRRTAKKVNGTLTQGFLYNTQLQIVAELDGAGTVVSRFVYADRANVPSFMVKGGTTYRIISDHLGSPRLVVNSADGSVAQKLDYDEFGNILSDSNPGFIPFSFAGGLYDQDTKLVRFGVRDYDPEAGRWTKKDPIRFYGGDTNLYGYVLNDSVNVADPWGLDSYMQNRYIGQDIVTSNSNPLSHTFIFTTNTDGSLNDTYSWGNEANSDGWNKNQPEDRRAAETALQNSATDPDYLNKIGDADFDQYIEDAFNDLNIPENEHANLGIARNCKFEARKLNRLAKKRQLAHR